MSGYLTGDTETIGRPGLTIAVLTCNRPELAADLVRQVLGQAHPIDQVVVIDDAGTAQQPFDGVTGVSVMRTGGLGAAAARNAVLGLPARRWTVFFDDDVVIAPDTLARFRQRIATCDCDVITGNVLSLPSCGDVGVLFDERYPLSRGPEVRRFAGSIGTRWGVNDVWLAGAGACMAWRTEVLSAIAGFPVVLGQGRRFGGAEDLAAFRTALLDRRSIVYDGELVVRHYSPSTIEQLVAKMRGYGQADGAFAAHVWHVERRIGMALHLLNDIIGTPRQFAVELTRRMRGLTHLPLRAVACFPIYAIQGFVGYLRLTAPVGRDSADPHIETSAWRVE